MHDAVIHHFNTVIHIESLHAISIKFTSLVIAHKKKHKPKKGKEKSENFEALNENEMSCSIAPTIPNSPIFQSPRHPSIFCKPCPSLSIIHGPQSPASSSSLPLPPSLLSSFSSSSPKSPLALRVNNETRLETITDTLLKRKRPGKLNIPVAGVSGFSLEIPKGEERVEVVEFEGDVYSVYCKRGRRGGIMEDRYSASVDVNGDSKKVSCPFFHLCKDGFLLK